MWANSSFGSCSRWRIVSLVNAFQMYHPAPKHCLPPPRNSSLRALEAVCPPSSSPPPSQAAPVTPRAFARPAPLRVPLQSPRAAARASDRVRSVGKSFLVALHCPARPCPWVPALAALRLSRGGLCLGVHTARASAEEPLCPQQVSPLWAHMRTAFLGAPADAFPTHPPHRCKKKVPASKRFTIHRTSNVLTLSLKRFANVSGGKITKVSPCRGVRSPSAAPEPVPENL